jgi:hypothetical protein
MPWSSAPRISSVTTRRCASSSAVHEAGSLRSASQLLYRASDWLILVLKAVTLGCASSTAVRRGERGSELRLQCFQGGSCFHDACVDCWRNVLRLHIRILGKVGAGEEWVCGRLFGVRGREGEGKCASRCGGASCCGGGPCGTDDRARC